MSRITGHHRRAFSLAEISIMAMVGLVLFVIIMNIIRNMRMQDSWTTNRLEGASGGLQALDRLRHDAARANVDRGEKVAIDSDGKGVALNVHAKDVGRTEAVDYQLRGSDELFMRDGRPISSSRFRKVVVDRPSSTVPGLVRVNMEIGGPGKSPTSGPRSRATTLGASVLVREENLRERFKVWADPPTSGSP